MLNMPKRIIERVGDAVYGPGDPFPYAIKGAGETLFALFGPEIVKRLAARRKEAMEARTTEEPGNH